MTFRNSLGWVAATALLVGAGAFAKGGGATTDGGSGKGGGKTTLPGPTPTPTPSPTPAPTPTPTATALPPLDLSAMRLWNYAGLWHASEWDNANSAIPWRYNRVTQPVLGDTYFVLDGTGAPQLQGVDAMPAYSAGLWEAEATLPTLRDGVIVAPLWLYNSTTRDEVDFELAGRKGLDVTIHAWPNGVHKSQTVRYFAGTDFSGKRVRFGIRMDQASGFAEMYVNGALIHRWDRAKLGYFPASPVKPWLEMWAANPANTGFVQWAGQFTPFQTGESMKMTVHGYKYTPLP
jgi:hypothetical protein